MLQNLFETTPKTYAANMRQRWSHLLWKGLKLTTTTNKNENAGRETTVLSIRKLVLELSYHCTPFTITSNPAKLKQSEKSKI